MGFTTGFLGGLTLTTSIIYLSLSAHRGNRLNQALLLRQQTLILDHIVKPTPQLEAQPLVGREVRAGVWETTKDRWNRQVEVLVRRLHNTDWNVVRELAEVKLGRAWGRVTEEVERRS